MFSWQPVVLGCPFQQCSIQVCVTWNLSLPLFASCRLFLRSLFIQVESLVISSTWKGRNVPFIIFWLIKLVIAGIQTSVMSKCSKVEGRWLSKGCAVTILYVHLRAFKRTMLWNKDPACIEWNVLSTWCRRKSLLQCPWSRHEDLAVLKKVACFRDRM